MAKYVIKSDKEVGYSGENQAIADAVFTTFCDLVKQDPSHGTIKKIVDGNEETAECYRPTNEELVQGQSELAGDKSDPNALKTPASAEAGMGVSESKLARRMPLLENLSKVYKGGKLLEGAEEGADEYAGMSDEDLAAKLAAAKESGDEACVTACEAEVAKRAEAAAGGGAKPLDIAELKEIPEDELVEITESVKTVKKAILTEALSPESIKKYQDIKAKLSPEELRDMTAEYDAAEEAAMEADEEEVDKLRKKALELYRKITGGQDPEWFDESVKAKINESEEAEFVAGDLSKLSDEELDVKLNEAEGAEEKDNDFIAGINAEKAKREDEKMNEAVDPESLQVGDTIKLMHKEDGEIRGKVKSIKDKRIYWSNDKGQMGSLSFDTAIKKIGKPGPKAKTAGAVTENKRKSAFAKK